MGQQPSARQGTRNVVDLLQTRQPLTKHPGSCRHVSVSPQRRLSLLCSCCMLLVDRVVLCCVAQQPAALAGMPLLLLAAALVWRSCACIPVRVLAELSACSQRCCCVLAGACF